MHSNESKNDARSARRRYDVSAVFIGTSLVGLIATPWYGIVTGGFGLPLWVAFFVFLFWNGLSITAGYHRLWSHKSYRAHTIVRIMFALGGALALQNSIKVWTSNHRTHHQHTDDNDKDPYSAGRGLWFAHLGWMLRDYPASHTDFENVRDLEKDWVVVWQHDYYWLLAFTMNVIVTLGIGALAGDLLAGLLLVGFSRLVISHHTTFFINSLAHFWGKQTYSDKTSSRDNTVLALLTYGEGYHNYHHTFQWDYRNGIRWYHFDPTKWLIAGLAWFKLTWDLKVVLPEKIEKSLALMQLKHATDKVSRFNSINTDKWLSLLDSEYHQLVELINEWSDCRQQWLEVKKQSLRRKFDETELSEKLKHLESELNIRRREWRMLTQQFA